jgi:hypothetical protein
MGVFDNITWQNTPYIPRNDLLAWIAYLPNVSTHNSAADLSGNGRHLTSVETNAAVLTPGVINNNPAWYFNGSRIPLQYTGSLTPKHIFILVGLEETEFAAYDGILTGLDSAANFALVGNGGAGAEDTFYMPDFDTTYPGFQFLKNDVEYDHDETAPPFDSTFAVIELQFPEGIALDGLQIGQDREDTTRKMQGWFVDMLVYDEIKTDSERSKIYEYYAVRYGIWRQKSDGFPVFPFRHLRASEPTEGFPAEVSEAEGGRAQDRVVRYHSDAPQLALNLEYNLHSLQARAARLLLQERKLHLPYYIEDCDILGDLLVITDADWNFPGTIAWRRNFSFRVKSYETLTGVDFGYGDGDLILDGG